MLRHGSNEFPFSGRYTEATPHSRLVYTQMFEAAASGARPDDDAIVITAVR